MIESLAVRLSWFVSFGGEPIDLGSKMPNFGLEFKDEPHAGDVQSRASQRGDLTEPFHVVVGVQAGSARASVGFDETLSLIDAKRLRM
jgi:hypothetical protein